MLDLFLDLHALDRCLSHYQPTVLHHSAGQRVYPHSVLAFIPLYMSSPMNICLSSQNLPCIVYHRITILILMHHQASPQSRTPWKPPRKPPTISGWGRSSCVFMVRAGTRLISSAGCAYARDHSTEPRRFEVSSPQQRGQNHHVPHPFLRCKLPAS